jgi:DNA-binding transcriptional LysR family regulator
MRMRRSCNDVLFIRTSHGMVPTALAEHLAKPVHQALGTLEAAFDPPGSFDPATSKRRFRLLMSDVGELVILPKLMDALRKSAAHVVIDVTPIAHTEYANALEHGDADLAIGNLAFLNTGFYQQRLFKDRYICVARQDHPIIRGGLSLGEYLGVHHIQSASGNADSMVDLALSRKRLRRHIALRVAHYHIAIALAAKTDLIATIPEYAVPAAGHLQVFRLPVALPPAEVRQFWHKRFQSDPANRWMRMLIAGLPLSFTALDP